MTKTKILHKLDLNERVSPPTKSFLSLLKKKLGQSPAYTRESEITKFENLLSKYHLLPKNFLSTFPGSFHCLISIFIHAFGEKDEIIIPTPTFPFYGSLEEAGRLNIKKIPIGNKSLSLETIKKAVSDKTKGLYLVNPGNPFGQFTSASELKKIITLASKKKILVVLDEAYVEFGEESVSSLVKDFNNLIIVRTFSKAFGLSGFRLGYCLANPDLTKKIRAWRGPSYVLNNLGLTAGEWCLKNLPEMKKTVIQIKTSQKLLEKFCLEKNIPFTKSATNFITIKVKNSDQITTQLAKFGFMVKNLNGYPDGKNLTQNHIRITLPPPTVTKKLIKVLGKII